MRTTKLVTNVLSLVLFLLIIFQSCAVGFLNSLEGNTEDSSGGAGVVLAVLMLVAAIVGLVTRKENKGDLAVTIIYGLAAIVGFSSLGTFTDLIVWSVLSLLFAILNFISFLIQKKKSKNPPAESTGPESL